MLPAEWFRPSFANRSLKDLDKCASATEKTSWPTFSAKSWSAQVSELEAMKAVVAMGRLQDLDTAWLSILFHVGLVVRKKGTVHWFVSLGDVMTSGALGWPCEMFDGEVRLKTISSSAELAWMFTFDAGEWEAVSVEWRSPLHSCVLHKVTSWKLGVVGRSKGPPADLLSVAARAAFWSWGVGNLKMLAQHLELPAATGEAATLKNLVKGILGCTDQECVRIMEQRLSRGSSLARI
jgi:hypothetical protein